MLTNYNAGAIVSAPPPTLTRSPLAGLTVCRFIISTVWQYARGLGSYARKHGCVGGGVAKGACATLGIHPCPAPSPLATRPIPTPGERALPRWWGVLVASGKRGHAGSGGVGQCALRHGGVTGVVVSGGLLAGSARLIQAPTRCRDGSGGNASGQAGTRAHLSLSSLCVAISGGASSGWNPWRAHSQCLALLPHRGWRKDQPEKQHLQAEVCSAGPRRLLLVACLASSNRLLGEACSAGPRHQPPLTKGINYSQRYHSTKGMNSKLP